MTEQATPTATAVTFTPPDEAELNRGPSSAVRAATMTEITCKEDRTLAVEDAQELSDRLKTLEEQRTTITRPLLEAQRATNELFRKPKEALESAIATLKAKILAFDRAEREAQEKAQREAQEKARLEAEAQAQAAAARAKEAADAAAALQAQAQVAADQGDLATAAALDMQAASASAEGEVAVAQAQAATYAAPAQVAQPIVSGGRGTATARKYKAMLKGVTEAEKQVALLELVKHVAMHPEHLHLLAYDEKAGNDLAKALKTAMAIPGLQVYADENLSLRRGAK